MAESEIKKVYKWYQEPVGKIGYTSDNTIQMKASGDQFVGFSSILNNIHNANEKENLNAETFFITKQFFDFVNIFIKSTFKKDTSMS